MEDYSKIEKIVLKKVWQYHIIVYLCIRNQTHYHQKWLRVL